MFYNAKNQIVAYISVCFQCNKTNVFPIDGYRGVIRYKSFFEKLNFPIFEDGNEVWEYIQMLRKVSK